MKSKVRKISNEVNEITNKVKETTNKVKYEQILVSKEVWNKVIDNEADLTLCLTLFATMYNYIRDYKDDMSYTLKFCVDEGINLVKKHYPDSFWKDVRSLTTNEEGSMQKEKDKILSNVTTLDASQLNCPCYNCPNWNETWDRCRDVQRDCVTYCNWYSNTFKN